MKIITFLFKLKNKTAAKSLWTSVRPHQSLVTPLYTKLLLKFMRAKNVRFAKFIDFIWSSHIFRAFFLFKMTYYSGVSYLGAGWGQLSPPPHLLEGPTKSPTFLSEFMESLWIVLKSNTVLETASPLKKKKLMPLQGGGGWSIGSGHPGPFIPLVLNINIIKIVIFFLHIYQFKIEILDAIYL